MSLKKWSKKSKDQKRKRTNENYPPLGGERIRIMDIQKGYCRALGFLLILAAIALGTYLCLWVMLYGGIMQAITNWGTNNSAVVWGIIRAVFFELGALPAYVLGFVGVCLLKL